MILVGTFGINPVWAAFAALGVILSAIYMLWMYQRAILGEITDARNETLTDLNGRELATLLPLAALIIWMGVYSSSFLRPMDASIDNLLEQFQERDTQFALEQDPGSEPSEVTSAIGENGPIGGNVR